MISAALAVALALSPPLPVHRALRPPPDPEGLEALDVSPDGLRVAVAGESTPPRVLDLATGAVVATLGTSPGLRVAFGPPDRVAVARPGRLELYRLPDGARVAAVEHDAAGGLAFCGGGRWAILGEWRPRAPGAARVLDAGLEEVRAIPATGSVLACARDRLAVGGATTLALFELPTGRALAERPLSDDDAPLHALAFGPKHLAALSLHGSVSILGRDDLARRAAAPPVTGQALALAFSPAGDLLAGDALLPAAADVPALGPVTRLPHPRLAQARFLPDGRLVALRSSEVHVLDVAADALAPPPDGHRDAVRSMATSPRGDLVASGDERGRIYLWDPDAGRVRRVVEGHAAGTFGQVSVAFSPDGARLYSAGTGLVRAWRLPGLEPLWSRALADRDGPEHELRGLQADARLVAVAGHDEAHVLWAATGLPVRRLPAPSGAAGALDVALHPGGSHVAVAAQGGPVSVFLMPGPEAPERTLPAAPGDATSAIFFDRRGRLLRFDWSAPATVSAWPDLAPVQHFEMARVDRLAFAPDGASAVWGSFDGALGLFAVDAAGLHPRWRQDAPWHVGAVAIDAQRRPGRAAAGGPQARREGGSADPPDESIDAARGVAYSTGPDYDVSRWDLRDGAPLGRWVGAAGAYIERLAFSDDGATLFVGANDGGLRVFDLAALRQTAFVPGVHLGKAGALRAVGGRLVVLTTQGLLRVVTDGVARDASTEYGVGAGLSADGTRAVVVTPEGTARRLPVDGAPASAPVDGAPDLLPLGRPDGAPFVSGAALSPDGEHLYVLRSEGDGHDATVEVWDLTKRRRRAAHPLPPETRVDRLFAVADRCLVSLSDGAAFFTPDGRWTPVPGVPGDVRDVTPDGRLVTHLGESVHVVESATGRVVAAVVAGAGSPVYQAATSPDGRTLALGTFHGDVELWDLATGAPRARLRLTRHGGWSARPAR